LFVGADALHLPFQDKTFDVVVAGELLEHLSNAGSFLDEAWRILSPSGILVGTVPNACHGTVYVFKGDTSPASKDSTHVHLFDDWTLSILLLQHNLLISNIAWLFSAYSPISKFTASLKRRLFPRTAYGIGFITKKITKSQSTKIMGSFSDELREKRVEWANRLRPFSKH
jgi:SAM-dependent methyltransferase